MATKKYEILKNKSVIHKSIVYNGRRLYRITALKDFVTVDGRKVYKGEIGGFVESENNLSQEGTCWIFDDAIVYDDAVICDNAIVCDAAKVCNEAKVYDKAKVTGCACISKSAKVYGTAFVYGYAKVCGDAEVYGDAYIGGEVQVYDNAKICDKARAFGEAVIFGNAKIFDSATVYDKARVLGNAQIYENAEIFDNSYIAGDAKIHGYSYIFGNAVVCDDAEIFDNVEVSGTAIIFGVAKIGNTKISDNQKIEAGEFMYDAVDITTLLPKVQAMHKQVLRMCAGKYLIDENYLDNIIKEFNEYDKARKVKEELYHVTLPLKAGEVCALLEEISNALEKNEKSKRFNKEVDNQ